MIRFYCHFQDNHTSTRWAEGTFRKLWLKWNPHKYRRPRIIKRSDSIPSTLLLLLSLYCESNYHVLLLLLSSSSPVPVSSHTPDSCQILAQTSAENFPSSWRTPSSSKQIWDDWGVSKGDARCCLIKHHNYLKSLQWTDNYDKCVWLPLN